MCPKLRCLILPFIVWSGMSGYCAEVDTVTIFSAVMQKHIKAAIVKPESSTSKAPKPVVYLLHGYSGNHTNWVANAKEIQLFADQHDVMFVSTDGGFNSWYWDSPVDSKIRYESYIIRELIPWVDEHYPTVADRSGRAITGFSMGGHGALYLAFRNQHVFGAAGSMSGAVDIRPFYMHWEMAELLGPIEQNPERWAAFTVTEMISMLKPGSLSLIIDCGTEDFFYEVNEVFHQKLLRHGISHTYITGPGGHDWDYWRGATSLQLQHFKNWFGK